MNKKELHNLTRNRIKTVFKAKQRDTLVFNSVWLSLQLTFVVTAISLVVIFSTNKAESNRAQDVLFGVEQTTNIFPTKVSSDGWSDVESVFTQDLSDDALYQDFSDNNSAQFTTDNNEEDNDVSSVIEIDAGNESDSSEGSTSEELETENPTDPEAGEDAATEPEQPVVEEVAEPEPEPEPEPASEPVSFNFSPILNGTLLKSADQRFPLAQLTLTSSTQETIDIEDVTPDPVIEEPVLPETTEDIILVDDEVEDETPSESEVIEDEYVGESYEITLSNFDIAQLEGGEFIDGMQLRVSFGARANIQASATAPYVDVLFGDDDSMQSVGSILIDDEASNAFNGGYYLFTLPSFIPVDELKDSKVTLRYRGEKEMIEGMYLDAAWLEMNTRVLSKEDLLERGLAEHLTHLEAPKLSVLLSDQLNFDRTEHPVFNLRYEPQQNIVLRGLMRLLGRSSLEVSSISVNHESIGSIPIEPEITVTDEGLVTIELPEEQTDVMPPGTYEINVQFNENGNEYTDTFNFQWGILTLNPHKSEYEVGELAEISLGALSPNGNTLCDAELALYVTNPEGFIAKVPVEQSGQCNGNNVTDVADYAAFIPAESAGVYELYLERLDETGALIGFTTDSFKVTAEQNISIQRNGPTRIFPRASYPMELTVAVDESFDGVLRERVPASFVISSTTAEITEDGDWQVLSWDISINGSGAETVSYGFDAPDISPYLYNLGVASIEGEVSVTEEVTREIETEIASSSESAGGIATSTVTEQVTTTSDGVVFEEHRQWQIASDATGSMVLMWDGPTIPTGWTCISCTGGDVFYQRFIMGSATPGATGGATTHGHTASAAVNATASGGASNAGGGGADAALNTHTHTVTPTIGTGSNLPAYRNLVIIQHNSAGEPLSIPAGAIALFDASVPSGWTQYSAQNGFYVRGESIANRTVTGGSNTHTHTITGTLSGPNTTTNASGAGTNISTQTHTHTISSNTAAQNHEPPYIQAILGKLNATSTMPNDSIAMWTDTEPTDWNAVSSSSQPFENRIFRPGATYGATGGATNHTPANVNGITSSGPSANVSRQAAGTSDAVSTHTHSVNVTGFTNANHLPPYRTIIFAKRAGGLPPDAPVIHELFDNEKTGTSTPEFEFTAQDPAGTDNLLYQFQWDDDSDLNDSPLGDRTSNVETGCSPNCFINTVNGGDTSPFNENERIRFTIQSGLTDGITYHYRVRARKAAGTTWGSWSAVNSFTYVADTDPSQWYQTSDAQFDTGVYLGAETFGSNSVRIAQAALDEVMVAYGEGAVTTPRYRIWDGTTWSTEASAQSVGGTIQWVRTAAGITRDEYILGTQDASNDVNVQVYDGNSGTWGDLVEVTTTIPDNTRRGFDVAYETTSGDALVVYCNGNNAAYRVWNGSSWSGATTITTVSGNNCNYISLASDPVSDEIIMVTRDTSAGATDYEAWVWDGSAWGNTLTGGSITDTNNEGIAIEYEESGGQAMVVVSNGGLGSFVWSTWNGTEWSTAATHAIGDDFQWGVLKSDVGTDNLALCYIDTDDDIGFVRWDGDAWQTTQEFETGGNIDTGRAVSCEFETTPGRDGYIMIPYSDTSNARYRDWNGATLSGESSISTIQDSWEVNSVRAGDGKILGIFHDDVNTQYDFSYWDGSAWSSIETLEGSPSVTVAPFRQPIDMSAKIFQFAQGSITSDPVSFGLVPGRPTWGEALWSTTEPTGTNVTVQVLYATTSACNVLVPDGALPGNSTGFSSTDVPLNLSTLSTSTYNSLCLRATLTSDNQNIPTLDDWTISWERQPFFAQSQYRWYANRNLETPNDAWPVGATDLMQNEEIPQAYSPGSGDVLRLRMAARIENAALEDSSKAFKLQYTQATGQCGSSTAWYDVGEVGSTTTEWRGFNNLLAFDGSTLGTLLLGSDVAGTYEEENDSDVNPNTVSVGQEIEWDWVLEHNNAIDGVQYCFRMVTAAGAELSSYEQYPTLITNASPEAPTLEKLFDNAQVASTSPWFEFTALDPEDEDITYQIQIDNNHDFSSTVLDRNSAAHFSEFENIVTPADKDPFTAGQTVRFKPSSALSNGTTYYWRVRGIDGAGSNTYGEWSTINSFTVNTATVVTTWYQTQSEQFDTNDNVNTETTGSNDVVLTGGFLSGTTTSTVIDFDNKSVGNAWGTLSWNNNLAAGSIRYYIEYQENGEWVLVPNTFLPGNDAGFTSSPVSLLGLDPQVHNEIRVRANLADSGGTPRLLDWTISWGLAVEQPTQLALFDNEKTGTTTPTLIFTTTDPDNDDIQYELSWSADRTFATGVNVATSGVSAGFSNVTTGADTSPFFSGDTINYKFQSALTNGNTYWWRVRGRDPSDGNAWSVWSPTRSFTVDTSVTVSTWFQTTDAQFETDALNDTQTTGGGSVEVASIVREAMFAYAEGTVQVPRYRLWNGTSWSEEASGISVGGAIRFVQTAAAHSRDEYMIVTQEGTGRVRAQVYDGVTDTADDLETIIAAVPGLTARGFDVAYESSSGDAVVVACSGTEATYSVWNGSSWSGPNALTLAVTANCNWIELAADPTSDEIILVVRDAITGATDYQALVWNGSSWGNSMTMGSMAEAADAGISVEYEESGDRAVVVVSNGAAASFAWNSWNGSAWSGVATQGLQDDFENGRLSRDVGTDDMALCSIDQDGQIALVRWTGTTNSWNAYQTIDTLGNSKTGRPSDCVFETNGSRDGYIMIPYSDTTAARSRFWNGVTLSTEGSISTITDSQEVRAVRTGDGNILSFFYDDVNTQYDFSFWNGVTWSSIQTLESTAITTTNPRTVPFSVSARRFPTFTEGTVVSSAIDFDEGSGLKWQSVSFADTTPGSSDILYQIEYLNGDSWELIPDGALSGNSSGFASSPIDISNVSRITYNTIRLVANINCAGADCPTLNDWTVTWSAGINVSGTAFQYNQTASSTSGTVAIAVNGTVQAGKTGIISNGSWTIPNVTAFPDDVVTVFVTGASDSTEAVGVTKYDGDGDITGLTLFERHLSIGSNDAAIVTNADLALYDFTNTEDVFFDVAGSDVLTLCATSGCADAEFIVLANNTFTSTGNINVRHFENNGTFDLNTHTMRVGGSWDNNATTTMDTSSVIFTATTTDTSALPWYNPSWLHRVAVTIAAAEVDSDVTDFPVYVDLSDFDATFFSNVTADGGDIRVTTSDGVTELAREIVAINTISDTGEIYFKANSLSASTDTTFYIYYNNAAANDYAVGDTYGRNAVWDNGYEAVYHMQESPSAGAPQYVDSTGNSTATAVNMEGGDQVAGLAGNAADVDGVDESIQTTFSQNLLDSTWSLFLNVDGTQGACDGVMFSRGTGVNGMNLGACGDVTRIGYHWDNAAAASWNWAGGPVYPTNQWFMATLVIQPTVATAYAHTGSGVTSGANTTTHTTSNINNLDFGWDSFGVARSFNGAIDESRLSSVARSVDWLDTEYRNLAETSSFYTAAASEPYSTGTPVPYVLDDEDGVLNFYNVTFGETSGTSQWEINDTLDIENDLTVAYGTLDRNSLAIIVGRNLHNQANGWWSGVGTTTFDGSIAATWRDQNASLQNVGNVVVDGTSKNVTLASNVAAQSILIGANDTLDASTSNYDLTVYGNWNNQNNFTARSGEVFFASGSPGNTITTAGDAFFDLTFSGSGGGWAFTESSVQINNDLKVSAGTVTLPTATTTIAGSFNATGGTFQNNNGTMLFTSGSAETITFAGGAFTNVAYNLRFSGAGNWTVADTNATSTNDVRVTQGTLNFPSGTFAVGGNLVDAGGAYTGGTGTVRFYSAAAEVLTAGGSSFSNVVFDGVGSWSFSDSSVTVTRNLTVNQGTLTLPATTLSIAGSYDNNATVVPGTGTVQFNSTDAGETIDFGASALNNIVFNNAGGGWTVVSSGTTTNALTITNAASLTVNPGTIVSVGGTFTNSVGGAATTWTGSTLALRAGNYSLNTKVNNGDTYGTLIVDANTDIKMWNSSSTAYAVNSTGSLYSQDHNAVNGDLYIFGSYERTSGTEYWSYATDFDGVALGGTPRQANVRFADGASATFTGSAVNILGDASASTTVENQDMGSYTITINGGSLNASRYAFADLGTTGVSLLGAVSVSGLNDGTFALGIPGTTGLRVSSTTINANPALQIFGVGFASTSNDTWLNEYERRKSHTLNAATGAGTNYQVQLTVHYGSGSDSGDDVYLGGNVQTDFDDIRFTTADGVTELSYWIESKVDGDNAVVWVKVADDLSSVAQDIYIYYDNDGATSGASGQNTFEFFDDFSGDLSKWTIDAANTDAVAISGGALRHNPDSTQSRNAFFDTRIRTASYQMTDGVLDYEVYLGGSTASDPRIIHQFGWRVQSLDFENGYAFRLQNTAADGGHFEFATTWAAIGSSVGAITGNTWHTVSETVSGSSYSAVIDGGSPTAVSDSTKLTAGYLVSHVHGVGLTGSSYVLVDDVRVRKYVSPEPSHAAWGSEEEASAASIYNVTELGTPSSYWWFREHYGDYDGEANDNDPGGNPGHIRWDDSSLLLTVSGTVYSDAGVTPITGGTCNGSAQVVRVVVEGGASYTGSCSNVDGTYSIANVAVVGDKTLTIYLDGASGGEKGSVITRTPTANITDADIYANRVIVRNEDVEALTIANLALYDSDNDADLNFSANGSFFTVVAGNELYVWNNATFTPGGTVSLLANAGANSYDGTLYLDDGATFNAHASTTLTVGGRFVVDTAAVFNAASTTVLMNATTSGKSITSSATITFNTLTFNGAGGTWNLGAPIVANGNMNVTTGIVTGTSNITLPYGSIAGNGVLSLGAGTTTIARSNTLGGTSAWTFHNLQLGTGSFVGTTTPVFTATTTVSGRLTIATAHFLDAGATTWDLSGTGTVFVENGTFLEDTSTVRYSGAGANVRSTSYYNLDINAGAGSQTYTGVGLGIAVQNHLTIGGTGNSTLNLTTSDPLLDVNGSVTIRSNGTFSASDTAIFTVAGNYTNDGTFTNNNGTITFDGAGTTNIATGNSSFANVRVAGTGNVSVTEHATSTGLFRIQSASNFTLASGQTLAVGGTFLNILGGSATTWTGSTLSLYGGGNYSINAATTSDSYATLAVDGTTQIRMWNSDAAVYAVDSTASLYSQDHANTAGDLYIWGSYRKTSGNDYWSYATDFDGAALGGGSRKVDVFINSGSSVSITGGSLEVYGTAAASTTLQNQGSGSYGITIGGTASSSWQYYEVTDANSSGLVLTGSPSIETLSFGTFAVSQNGGSAITVGGSVITQNPAKNFTQNRFILDGVGSGFNVTATGTTPSAWRFANHGGDIDGEAFDVDPNGDPGYIAWDDSAALITVSGTVYSDEGSTASPVCDGSTNNVTLRVAGITSYSTSCNAVTGAYSISNVSYGSADALIVYIDGETEKGATVTQDPLSNINNLSIYENRVIVRHESTGPLTIDDMAVWDSSDDADIPFTAINGSPDTLTLPANRKLIVWGGKSFAPGGNVTISGGGAGAAYDGTLELYASATWTGAGTQSLSVGGSMILNAGADFVSSTGTTTFTTTGTSRTIDLNENSLHNVAFTGSGSWNITDSTFTANGNTSITNGTLDLPTGTSTFNGSFVNNGGTFDASNGSAVFAGTGTRSLRMGGSSFATTTFAGGTYNITDVNATTTGSVTIQSGTLRLPSARLSVGGDFNKISGAILHNNAELVLYNPISATLRAAGSDLYGVTFAGGGNYTMLDTSVSLLDSLLITDGNVTFASGTIAIGGSLDASGGTFDHSSSTILFNSADTGEVINPGVSDFYAVQIAAPGGGYSLTGNATTTHNFSLLTATSFTAQSGVVLRVEGVFTNTVGGSATNWNGSTLVLAGQNGYTINTKIAGGDIYNSLQIAANTDIRMWNSSATTTNVAASGSLYSQDHATVNGFAYVYGDFHIGTTTEYWSYTTDFDGTALGGSPRAVTVHHAANSVTSVDGGTLNIVGVSGNETLITNQGSGTYALNVSAGTFNAQYYEFRNLGINGLNLSGIPTINSLSYGDFELAVNGGSLITVASSTLNANASLVFSGNRFATTTAITGNNVTLDGLTSNAWTFMAHTGNLDGEAFDVDGVDECGAIRWSDSECLITQQTHFRWRNDDGGVGVPNSEWYNASWDARKSVKIENVDASSYTDAVVQIFVDFDSDMQADFDDLRFTSDDGLTLIPHWIGSSTDSTRAEVWVKVPTLPADNTATVFMYYNNPSASSVSSMENTFIAADDFEDNDISEYSGQTSLFDTGSTFAFDGGFGLDNAGSEANRSNTGGIFRLDQTVSQGETFRFMKYIDTVDGSGDEVCTKFGVQSPGTANDNYAICIEQFGIERISLARDVIDNDTSGIILASSTVTYVTGWYEIEVEWGLDDSFVVSLYNDAGTLVTSFSDTDGTYTSGGIGMSYWFHYGGWDSIGSRPTLATEPTIRFGAEQGDGGATWKAGLNTVAAYDINDIARLRIAVENSGLAITNQQLLLEYAAMGALPSCEAVSPSDFEPVPVQASCGSSPVCMQSSTLVTNAETIGDLLFGVNGTFTSGQLREDPSNITSSMDIGQDQYTEIEYVITPTVNTIDENLCFRVTNNGTPFDTYLSVAHMSFIFDPTVSNVILNGGDDISLLPGTTTRVYATSTVTDLNGAGDLAYATTTFFRSAVSGGAACTPNNNDCYIASGSQCTFTDCSGNSCELQCYADIFFHADATDDDAEYDGQHWIATTEVEDYSDGYGFETSMGQVMNTLQAIDVHNAINYGALAVEQNTEGYNASTTVQNQGNVEVNIDIQGTDMTDGMDSQIPANMQIFATSTFTYAACTTCSQLSSTTAVILDVDLPKPITNTPPIEDAIYWGVEVPLGVNSVPHQGINVFTPRPAN